MAEPFFYHALIRTHHISSRKKIATLKTATKKLDCHVVLKSGGVPPGIMFVEGRDRAQVQRWIAVAHGLRYKAYELTSPVVTTAAADARRDATTTARPPPSPSPSPPSIPDSHLGCLEEIGTVREMAALMESRGLSEWWRRAMGYTTEQP